MFSSKEKKEAAKLKKIPKKNWYNDRYEFVKLQRNILGLVTMISLTSTALSVLAVATLTDSKTFEPYVVQIEKRTGITTVVDQQTVQRFSDQDIVRRYFIAKYVMARESFNLADYQYNYSQVVRLMSSYSVFQDFRKEIDPEVNKNSPVAMPKGYRKVVKIKSISFLNQENTQAQVRISVEPISYTGNSFGVEHRVIIMNIEFFKALELGEKERLINPLNFQVKAYRNDKDSEERVPVNTTPAQQAGEVKEEKQIIVGKDKADAAKGGSNGK